MSQSKPSETKIILLVIGFCLIFFLIRIRVFSAAMLFALFAGAVYGLYLAFRAARNKFRRSASRKTAVGQIEARLEQCRNLLEKTREEDADIQRNIQDLESKTASVPELYPQRRLESGKLLDDFRSESRLRRAKIAFFESCIRKLENLLHNHLLAQELETKRERLRQLRENQYEELAQLEAIRTELEMDAFYLQTIEELSTKMVKSATVDDAEHLRLELEEMTRELDER